MEDSDGHRATFHVLDDDGIGADPRVVTDGNGPENLCASADIDMVADHGQSFNATTASECNLLKYKAIDADPGARVDDDSIRVRDQEASADVAIERNVGSRHDAPKPVAEHDPFSRDIGQGARSALPTLIGAHAEQQLATGIPKLTRRFPCPIGNFDVRNIVQGKVDLIRSRPSISALNVA
jgi:hypothetical protein